ncbi:MAG: lipid-A-disaccharide synthase [Thermodesulfobacteriota bacterium]
MTHFEDNPPAVWISAAEASADLHGAGLVRALQEMAPGIRCFGMGGPEMRSTGFEAVLCSEELSVMGLTEVVTALPRIFRIYKTIKVRLLQTPPACLILLDAPDFHFRLARMAHRLNIPVFYYISPQIWAWRKGRVRFIRKYVTKMLCIFPFEKDFFAEHGVEVEFVGHPLLEQLEREDLARIRPDPDRIGIMPGSRGKEISALLPAFAAAAARIAAYRPGTRFSLFLASKQHRPLVDALWPRELDLEIIPFARRYAGLKGCAFVLTASGTATLECALLGVPAIVAYRVSWPTYFLARLVVDVPYISMPNIILDQGVFPEFIQSRANGENLAGQALAWLEDKTQTARIRDELKSVQARLGQKRASAASAGIILQGLIKE